MSFILLHIIKQYLKIRGINYSNSLYWYKSMIICDIYPTWNYRNKRTYKEYLIDIKGDYDRSLAISFSNIMKIHNSLSEAMDRIENIKSKNRR